MFTDFVCFEFYFRDYVAQPYSQIGTAYICSSIKVLSRNAQRRIFVDCAGVRFIMHNKVYHMMEICPWTSRCPGSHSFGPT